MAKQSWYKLLRRPEWQRKRLEIMERAGFKCENCGDAESTLNVHHGYYEKGLKPWEYPDETLYCYCEKCHEKAKMLLANIGKHIGCLDIQHLYKLAGYIHGIIMKKAIVYDNNDLCLDVGSFKNNGDYFDGIGNAFNLLPPDVWRIAEENSGELKGSALWDAHYDFWGSLICPTG